MCLRSIMQMLQFFSPFRLPNCEKLKQPNETKYGSNNHIQKILVFLLSKIETHTFLSIIVRRVCQNFFDVFFMNCFCIYVTCITVAKLSEASKGYGLFW